MTRPPGTRLRTAAGTYPARGESRALHVDVWSLCLVCLFVCLPSVCLLAPEGGEQPTRTGQVASGMGSDAPSHGVYALCACVSVCLLDCWGETVSPPPARPGMSCARSRSLAHSLTLYLSLSCYWKAVLYACSDPGAYPARGQGHAWPVPGEAPVGGATSPWRCGDCAWCVRVNVCRPVRSSVGAFAVSHARRRGAQAPGELQGLAG